MSETRHQKFIIARLVYGASGLLSMLLGLGGFVGIVLPSKTDVRFDLAEPLTYVFALLCSLPFLVIGLALWLRGRYWRREAHRGSWRKSDG